MIAEPIVVILTLKLVNLKTLEIGEPILGHHPTYFEIEQCLERFRGSQPCVQHLKFAQNCHVLVKSDQDTNYGQTFRIRPSKIPLKDLHQGHNDCYKGYYLENFVHKSLE